MHRPGFLNGHESFTPKHSRFGDYLGAFGKGMVAPPPGPPPGIPPGGEPPQFIEGKWQCSGSQPPSEADGYYYCCPVTGWTKVGYDDKRPCGENYGMLKCGPLPEGASIKDAICCESLKEWVPKDPSGADPCVSAALLKSQATGRAIPGVAETILAEDIIAGPQPLVTPQLMIAGAIAVAALFGLTIFVKLMR